MKSLLLVRTSLTTVIFTAVISSTSSFAVAQYGPYWLDLYRPIRHVKTLPSGKELVGRSFLLVPLIADDNIPRHDPRILLTFESNAINDQRVVGEKRHQITFNKSTFSITNSATGIVDLRRAKASKALGVGSEIVFTIGSQGSGNLRLLGINRSFAGRPMLLFGNVRELTEDETVRFRDYLSEGRVSEEKQRTKELDSAANGTPAYIDTHTIVDGGFFKNVYLGHFDKLGLKPSKEFTAKDISANKNALRHYFQSIYHDYHTVYGRRHGDTQDKRLHSGEEWIKVDTFLVKTMGGDPVGNPVVTDSIYVRERFRDTYVATQSTEDRAMSTLGDMFNQNVKRPQELPIFRAASRSDKNPDAFLDLFKENSPGIVDHFENNLQRALDGREPLTFDNDAYTPFTDTVRLPWEKSATDSPGGPANREGPPEHGLTWMRPQNWGHSKSAHGIAGYLVGTPPNQAKIEIHLIDDREGLLQRLNMFISKEQFFIDRQFVRGKRRNQSTRIQDIERLDMFEVDGRTVYYLKNDREAKAFIPDGSKLLIIMMYGSGSDDLIQDHHATFKSFLQSILWNNKANITDQNTHKSTESTSSGRSRTRTNSRERRSR
jgi:hypothetical protein